MHCKITFVVNGVKHAKPLKRTLQSPPSMKCSFCYFSKRLIKRLQISTPKHPSTGSCRYVVWINQLSVIFLESRACMMCGFVRLKITSFRTQHQGINGVLPDRCFYL